MQQIQWNWLKGGLILGAVFLLAVILVKPIGVSTQFVIFDGIVWNMFSDDVVQVDENSTSGFSSKNAYLDKNGGKYAENIENPWNYGFIFVLAMIGGGVLSVVLQKPKVSKEDKAAPKVFRESGHGNRYLVAFIGGVLVLYGARLAGGCTSGHMMSGMMQTSLSGYLFAAGVFGAGIPVAIFFYRKSAKGAQ
ncbi:MAG: YeeE/YedE family protein [Xanthomonadales bacterium]|nr:YeeE/YedE family protein [Xanthomonadales bacterium]